MNRARMVITIDFIVLMCLGEYYYATVVALKEKGMNPLEREFITVIPIRLYHTR